MRKVVALFALALAAQAAPTQQPREWADKLFAESSLSHDFGNVPRGAVLSYHFTMTNIYAVPLTITGTRVSCGCVEAKPSKQVLQPKEKGSIDITMDARRFTGPKSVSIFVSVGPQFTSTATLTVSANSRADVVFNPGEISFGVVSGGQTPSQTIDVEYAGVLDWRVKGIAEYTAPLDITIKEIYREPGRVGYRLQVTLRASAPAGSLKHEIQLQTNDPASPLVPVFVEAVVQAPLSVVPSVVKLPSVKVGQETTAKILVNGTGDKEFRITGIDGLPDGITADIPPNPARVHRITLICKRTQPGDFKGDLKVKTDLPGGASTNVAVEGSIAP